MTADATHPVEQPKSSGRTRRWRRSLIISLIIVIVLAVVLRALVNLLLPTVLRKIAAGYDLDCDYERSELNLLNGDAALWHLTFTPKSGGDPILSLGYVRGNISTRALLLGALDVWRMEADGVEVTIERLADGSIPLLEKLQLAPRSTAAAAAKPEPAGKIDLTPPLKIDAFRLTQVRARIIDRTVTPAVDTTLSLSARVSDVQSPIRPITFELGLWSDSVLDLLYVQGAGRAAGKQLDADLKLRVRGFRPEVVAAYLRPLGIEPQARALSMEAKGRVKVTPTTAPAEAVAAELIFENIAAHADGVEAAGVDRVSVKAESISFDAAKVTELLIDGVRLSASCTAQGRPTFAGFELLRAQAPSRRSPPTTAPALAQLLSNYRISVDQASIRNVVADFSDQSFLTPASLSLRMDDLTVRNIVLDPQQRDATVTLNGHLRSPGLLGAVQLSGTLKPFAPVRSFELSISADGINPQAVNPYLSLLGLQADLKSARFAAQLVGEFKPQDDGRLSLDGRVTKLQFADAYELLAMHQVDIVGASFTPGFGAFEVQSVDIAGPTIRVLRDEAGEVSVLGLRTGAAAQPRHAAVASIQPAAADSATIALELPKVEIGRLTWKDVRVEFDDRTLPVDSQKAALTAGLELTNLTLGESGNTTAPSNPGRINAWLAAPGIVDRADLTGSIQSTGNRIATDLSVQADGVTAQFLKPYLARIGLEPALHAGRVQLRAHAALSQDANQPLTASLTLGALRYQDGDVELAGVDELRIKDLTTTASRITAAAIEVDKPRAAVARDAQGVLSAGGMRLVGTPTTRPSTTEPAGFSLPPVDLLIGKLRLNDASLAWTDAATTVPVSTTGRLTLSADGLAIGPQTAPATFTASASAEGIVDRFEATGTLVAARERGAMEAQVVAQGLRAGPLQVYAPPGIEASLRSGTVRAGLAASIAKNADGGVAAALTVQNMDFRDADAALLKLDSFVARASRIDPAGAAIAVDEIALTGFETSVRLTDDGAIEVPGLRVRPADGKPEAPATQPIAAEDVASLVQRARRPLMLLTLDKLDVGVSRLSVQVPGTEPVSLADWRVRNTGRIEVGGAEPETRPPIKLELTGQINPVVGAATIKAELAPLASQPGGSVDIDLSGIRGEGLTQLAPPLADYIDGSSLTDGRFRSRIEASGNFARGGNRGIDLTRPFELDIKITGTTYAAASEGPALAGVEQVHAEAIQVDPRTGGVRVKSVEVTNPMARAWREKDGVHLLGWVIKPPTTQPTTEPAPAEPASAPAAPALASAPPAAEVRIDRLLVSGLDVQIEDRAVDPPLIVPLNGLDAEIKGLSNLALSDSRTIRFNAVLMSDKTPLPAAKRDAPAGTEPRELFSQAVANGAVALYPKPSGWAKLALSGFELSSLRGLAHENDITLGKGIFDAQIDVRLKESGDIETRSRLVLTDLQISEPPNGPIQRSLGLPGTLDVVIKALQDPDGSITIPLSVPIRQGQLSTGDIIGAGAGALLSVITTAVASAPIKTVGGVGELLGGGGGKPEQPRTVSVNFAPGALSLSGDERRVLDDLVKQLRKDANLQLTLRHELGGGDVARAELLANPTRQECLELASRLRARKNSLLQERAQLAGRARAIVASSPLEQATPAVLELRELDRQIAVTEDALDRAYDLLKPGAQRQAPRRTRAASLEISRARLDAVQAQLLAGAGADAAQRITLVSPTYSPTEDSAGGVVQITLIRKKKQ